MNVIKIAIGFACCFLILLFALIGFNENPEKKRYEKTVQSIMIHQGLSSFQEVLDSFPELKDIESKMKRITFLTSSINSLTGGPAPNISIEQNLQIQAYTHEVHELRKIITEELTQLMAIHEDNRP